jgi:cob(I)alamin adenosyltransferase|tara:strand:- start:98554 stop:98856 length:303 start_codon:yes stop_codon:yes gene_type:complete
MNIASFMNKYREMSPEELVTSEDLEQDLAAIQEEVMRLDDDMKTDIQNVLGSIFNVLESQIVQINGEMKEHKNKMIMSKKSENACLAYLQSAGAKNTGRR